MGETFGARMRQRREAQGISLDTIARETKIKASLLEALEFNDLSHWPGGIFRRAFVRAYAHSIGLDPDATLGEFLAAFPPEPDVNLNGALHAPVNPAARNGNGLLVAPARPGVPEPGSDPRATASPSSSAHDLQVVAELCTSLGRVGHVDQLAPLLLQAAQALDARGVIVWIWDEAVDELRPALVHGYPKSMLVRLPAVRRDSDNVTAAAFRTGEVCVVHGGEHGASALAVPMLTPDGCAGVFAVELHSGVEVNGAERAVATILAALVAQLIGCPQRPGHASRESA
jgi:transcriptional regulator with XRE-family HTH domain